MSKGIGEAREAMGHPPVHVMHHGKSGETAAESRPPVKIDVMVQVTGYAVPEEGGGYSVIVPALPGCYTEGETLEEVQANLKEAAEVWLAAKDDVVIERGALR